MDGVGTPAQQVKSLVGSPAFRLLHRALVFRREQLLGETCTNDYQAAKNRGAVEELTNLLRHPEVLLLYGEAQQKAEAERDPALPPENDPYLERFARIVHPATDLESGDA